MSETWHALNSRTWFHWGAEVLPQDNQTATGLLALEQYPNGESHIL
jgi:hypothetical protein